MHENTYTAIKALLVSSHANTSAGEEEQSVMLPIITITVSVRRQNWLYESM